MSDPSMSDPIEYTPPVPEVLPDELRTDTEPDDLPPLDEDREVPLDEEFDDLLAGGDDIDPDIAP